MGLGARACGFMDNASGVGGLQLSGISSGERVGVVGVVGLLKLWRADVSGLLLCQRVPFIRHKGVLCPMQFFGLRGIGLSV